MGVSQSRTTILPFGFAAVTLGPPSFPTCQQVGGPFRSRASKWVAPSAQELSMVSLRQESFGKEEETRTLKPFVETLRVRIPPGKAGPAARSESCVVVGRPILRSVDSEVKGCVIEPRKYKPLGAFVLDTG